MFSGVRVTESVIGRPCCSTDGCGRTHYAKGLCKRCYNHTPEQTAKRLAYERDPQRLIAKRERDRKRQADPVRRAYKDAYDREHYYRKAMPRWAESWENCRRAEDLAELAYVPVTYGRGAQRLSETPRVRQFVAGSCPDCGCVVVVIRGWWHDSIRCPRCTKNHWRQGHRQRAKVRGVEYEHVAPADVFARDAYRCQICGRKIRGEYPSPWSATIDHIVPLSKGGPHVMHNLQTAHLRCNVKKYNGAANDQLRLAV